MTRHAIVTAGLLFLVSACTDPEPDPANQDVTWPNDDCTVSGASTFRDARRMQRTIQWNQCVAHHDADSGVTMLMLAGTGSQGGSFLCDASIRDILIITLGKSVTAGSVPMLGGQAQLNADCGESPATDGAELTLTDFRTSPDPREPPANPDGTVDVIVRRSAEGTLSVPVLSLFTSQGTGRLSVDLSFQGTLLNSGDSSSSAAMDAMTGSIALRADNVPVASGNNSNGGNGGGNCTTNRCGGLSDQCNNCGTCQAACYCAAACLCACSGESCEAGNREAAADLGTTCSY